MIGAVRNDMLRDRIVCGIYNKDVQRRPLQKAEPTYAKATTRHPLRSYTYVWVADTQEKW